MNSKVPEFSALLVTFLFFFFGFFLLVSKGNRRGSNGLLSVLFFCLGLSVVNVYLIMSGLYEKYPQYAFWFDWTVFLYGPILFFFTKSVLYKDFKLRAHDWYHFIPAATMFLYYVFYYHIQTLARKTEIYSKLPQQDLSNLVASLFIMSTMLAYIYFAHLAYQKYAKGIAEKFSSLEKKQMGWVKYVIVGFTGIIISSVVFEILAWLMGDIHIIRIASLISLFVLFVFIMMSIFRGLRYGASFSGLEEDELDERSKIRNSLSSDESISLANVKSIVLKEELFKSSDLTLDQLAEATSLPSRKLSQLLNDGLDMSFFDFINSHRIQYASDLLAGVQNNELTVLEIMYKSGFNSKSSFNTAFKRYTGTTPTLFKKKHL